MGGTPAYKIFGIFYSLGTIAFSFGDTILPEIQVDTCLAAAPSRASPTALVAYCPTSLLMSYPLHC